MKKLKWTKHPRYEWWTTDVHGVRFIVKEVPDGVVLIARKRGWLARHVGTEPRLRTTQMCVLAKVKALHTAKVEAVHQCQDIVEIVMKFNRLFGVWLELPGLIHEKQPSRRKKARQ